MDFLHLLPGIIWSGFLGLAIGNFATNPIYRLPRNVTLFGEDPYCGDCNAKLLPRDLFPVFSWLLTLGRCRYCGAAIPGAYTVTEAAIGILFAIAYVEFGFSEPYLLIVFGMTAFIMVMMMLYIDNFFSDRTIVAAIVCGMLYRVLTEGTLYNFSGSMFAGAIIGGLAWKISGKNLIRDAAAFPSYLKILVAAGAWLALPQLVIASIIALLTIPFRKYIRWLPEWTITGSVIAFLLIPAVL